MDTNQLPGAIEVVVIAKDGITLNDPEHHSLGHIAMGESAWTHESYLPHLREHGLACLAKELDSIDMEHAEEQIAALAAEMDAEFANSGDSEDPGLAAEEPEPPVAHKPKGRPRAR